MKRREFVRTALAVGVGAVVAMQSLGLLVTDAMSENVKAIVGGDIVLTPRLVSRGSCGDKGHART